MANLPNTVMHEGARSNLALTLLCATIAVSQLTAFGWGDLLPKKPEDLITVLTGGSLAGACNAAFKGRDGRAVATLVCGSLGVLVGQQIRQALKEREQVQLAEATNATLSTGKAQTVKTAEGSTLTTELVVPAAASATPSSAPAAPMKTRAERKAEARQARGGAEAHAAPPAAPASAVAVVSEGACGTVKQTVVTLDNQRFEDTVSACKKGDTWVAA